MPLVFFARFATFAPALGLAGQALYLALNQHDLAGAGHSLLQAIGLTGLGTFLHLNQSGRVEPPTGQ